MADDDKRAGLERRSGADNRSEEEKRLIGERRSRIDRRSEKAVEQPSNEQLALFAKRVRRAIRDEKSRHLFGFAAGEGEQDFRTYPDVLRTLDWIEGLANS
jgi:hypothetical protein